MASAEIFTTINSVNKLKVCLHVCLSVWLLSRNRPELFRAQAGALARGRV